MENWRALTLSGSIEEGQAAITATVHPELLPFIARATEGMQTVIEYKGKRQELRLLVRLSAQEAALCDAFSVREAVSESFTFEPCKYPWRRAQ